MAKVQSAMRWGVMLGAAWTTLAIAPAAQAPTLAMLDTLEKGNWTLKERGGAVIKSICVGDARAMLQIQHARAGCARYTIADETEEVTVHYTCPGAGHGRTTIRRETSRLVQIDTQGISSDSPFSMAIEARRTGPCA